MDVSVIGEKIKKRRGELGLTQRQLAQKLSVSNQLISKWETGESVPSLEYFDALCNALEVDFSYFTGSSGAARTADPNESTHEENTEADGAPEATVQAVQATSAATPAKKRRRKFNLKLFLIIAGCVLGALIIAGTAVLSVFVFAPAANKKKYIDDIEGSFQRYFNQEFYNVSIVTEIDGDVDTDYTYQGYFKEDGSVAFYNSKKSQTVVDGVLTYGYDSNYKYHYKQSSLINTVEELAYYQIFGEEEEDDFDLDEIKYIRKVKGGFYLEMSENYFFKDMSGTQKKNIELTDKIRGKVEVVGNIARSMSVTVKYRYKPDNEDFKVKVTMNFNYEKPEIAHENLDKREWWSEAVTGSPWIESNAEVDEAGFFSVLTDGKATKGSVDKETESAFLNGQVKDGGDCLFYVRGDIVVLNYDLSVNKKLKINNVDDWTNGHVYTGKAYYTDYTGHVDTRYAYEYDLATDSVTQIFSYRTGGEDDIRYYGRYAVYSDYWDGGYVVYDLAEHIKIYQFSSFQTVKCVDSDGSVYYRDYGNSDGKKPLMVSVYGETELKGTEFYNPPYYEIGRGVKDDYDVVCTRDDTWIYRYERGKLTKTFKAEDIELEYNYREAEGGHILLGPYVGLDKSTKFYCDDGTVKEIGKIKLVGQDGGESSLCDCDFMIDVFFGNKIWIKYDSKYWGVYEVGNFDKPLCFTENNSTKYYWDSYKVYRFDFATVVAIGVGDGYSYYVFNEN